MNGGSSHSLSWTFNVAVWRGRGGGGGGVQVSFTTQPWVPTSNGQKAQYLKLTTVLCSTPLQHTPAGFVSREVFPCVLNFCRNKVAKLCVTWVCWASLMKLQRMRSWSCRFSLVMWADGWRAGAVRWTIQTHSYRFRVGRYSGRGQVQLWWCVCVRLVAGTWLNFLPPAAYLHPAGLLCCLTQAVNPLWWRSIMSR